MKRFLWLALTVFALLAPTAEAQVCPAGSTCSPFESYLQTQNQATAPYGSGLHIPAAPNATAGSLVWIPASDFLTLTGSQTVSGKIINCANNTCTVRLGSDVTGNLSVSNLASGVGASSSTFWRGDGTWAAPPGGGGSPGGSSGNVQFNNGGAFGGLTDAQLTARIQAFTASLTGAVPASGGGTTNFLRADGTWSTPAGSGNVSAALNLTNNAPVIGDGGTTGIKTTAAMTNGQLLVGVTGSAPAPATMSGDATLAAGGAITIAANAITTGKINNQAVTYAKMQNGASNGLLGVNSAASPTEVTVGSGLNLAGGTLTATGGTVNTGTTNQLAYYASSTSAVSSNAHLSESGSALVVNYNAASLPAATAGTVLQIGGADTANTKLFADAFGTGAVPGMTGRQARGTAASPTASQTGDGLLGFNGLGRGATGYSSGPRASMVFGACENWSDTAQCGNITFSTTAPTTTTTNAKVAINGDGGVTVNTSAGAAPTGGTQGAGTINVATGYYVNGTLMTGGMFVGAATGTNTYTIAAPTPGGFTLTDQNLVCGSVQNTNTGAATLAVNGTTATAIKKQTASGLAALIGGEMVGSNTQYCWQYNATAAAYVLLTQLGSGVTSGATTHSVSQAEWDYNQTFVVTASSQTLTLPVATSLSPNGGITIVTRGNSVSLAPNVADGINGGSVNTPVTIPANFTTVVTTSGSSGTGAFNVPLGLVAGSNVTLTQNAAGTTTVAATGGAGTATIIPPQGRLTLTTGAPVMISDVAAGTTVYYDCYKGGNQVPFFNGSVDALDTIGSCEKSTAMVAAASAGQITAGDVFDVWWEGNTNHNICIAVSAASGGGGGWAADTAGSTTARGTGFTAIDTTTRPYITNKNALTHCFNGSTDYGSILANKATYLGSIYSTAAGTTKMVFKPAPAAGGANSCLCLFNAYNRVFMSSKSVDSSSFYTYGSATWSVANPSGPGSGLNNRISWVDGLGITYVSARYQDLLQPNSAPGTDQGVIGINFDSTTATPDAVATQYTGSSAQPAISVSTADANASGMGLHYAQAMISAINPTTERFGAAGGYTAITANLDD